MCHKTSFPSIKNLRKSFNFLQKSNFLYFSSHFFISLFIYCVFVRAPLSETFEIYQWHALGREEQAKYYELARRERQLHMQMYPDWSSRTNATRGKKRKRKQEPSDGGTNTLTKLTHSYNCFYIHFYAPLLSKFDAKFKRIQICENLRAN